MAYRFMETNQGRYTIKEMAGVLGVSCDSQDLICYSRTIRRHSCPIHNRVRQKLIFLMTALFFHPCNSLLGKELQGQPEYANTWKRKRLSR